MVLKKRKHNDNSNNKDSQESEESSLKRWHLSRDRKMRASQPFRQLGDHCGVWHRERQVQRPWGKVQFAPFQWRSQPGWLWALEKEHKPGWGCVRKQCPQQLMTKLQARSAVIICGTEEWSLYTWQHFKSYLIQLIRWLLLVLYIMPNSRLSFVGNFRKLYPSLVNLRPGFTSALKICLIGLHQRRLLCSDSNFLLLY